MPNSSDHTNDPSLQEGLNPTNFQKIVALLEKEIALEREAKQEKTKRNAKREEEETKRYQAKMEEEKSHDNNVTQRSKARAAVLKALEVADDAALEVLHGTLKSGKEQSNKNESEKTKKANKKDASNKKEAESNEKEPEALVEATNTNAAADKIPTPDTKKSPRRNSAGNSQTRKFVWRSRLRESLPQKKKKSPQTKSWKSTGNASRNWTTRKRPRRWPRKSLRTWWIVIPTLSSCPNLSSRSWLGLLN